MKTSFNNYIKEQIKSKESYFEHDPEILGQIHTNFNNNVFSTIKYLTRRYKNKLVRFEDTDLDAELIVSKIECTIVWDEDDSTNLLTFRFYSSEQKWVQISANVKIILKTKRTMDSENDPFGEDS